MSQLLTLVDYINMSYYINFNMYNYIRKSK